VQFLIDEDLPRSTANLVMKYGYNAIDVRDIGLRGAKDVKIISYAQKRNLCLIPGDYDFSDIRNYPPSLYAGIVVLHIHRDATASFILEMLEVFLKQTKIVSELSGKLAIIEPGRIRIRKS